MATLARNPVDIVNAHSSTDAWLDALACVWLERTRRATPVLVRTRHVSIPVPNDRATRWLYRRATARVVTTGVALREQLIRDNGLDAARVDSVPTGIDAALFAPLSQARRHGASWRCRTACRSSASSRRCAAGKAIAILHRRDAAGCGTRDAQLVIVGDGPQRAALEAQVDAPARCAGA